MKLASVFAIVAILMTSVAMGQEVCAHGVDHELKIYDVRDLVIDVPDFTDTPRLGMLEVDATSTTEKGADERVLRAALESRFADWIRAQVPANTLAVKIEVRAGSLIVDAEDVVHKRVTEELNRLRAERSTILEVRATIVVANVDALGKVDGDTRDLIGRLARIDQPVIQVDPAVSQNLLNELMKLDGVAVAAKPQIALFRQQRAWVATMQETPMILSYDKDAAGEWTAKIGTFRTGTSMDVRAMANGDESTVAMMVTAQFAQLNATRKRDFDAPGAPAGLKTDVPDVTRLSIERLLLLPMGEVGIVMLQPDAGAQPANAGKVGILFISARAVDRERN